MTIKISRQLLKTLLFGGGSVILLILLAFVIKAPAVGGNDTNVNLVGVFLTGLLTGGLTCLAVQGGLLAATIAQREEERLMEKTEKTGNAIPIFSFLLSKLLAYTLLGLLLGWFGSFFTLSLSLMGFLQVLVGIFMIGTALNMLNVHPIFRYFIIQPPRFLTRFVRKKSKSKDLFAPAMVGALTVFIPCGITQAMMALAIGSASPWLGTLIMFAFILGTSPVFFLLGYFTTKLSESLHLKFLRFAAVMIILMSLLTINNALALTGSKFTVQNVFSSVSKQANSEVATVSNAIITIDSQGYTPNEFSIKAGSSVKVTVKNADGLGCQQAFSVPKLGIQKIVRPGESFEFEMKAPETKGDIAFMCSMGMFTGVFHSI